MTDERIKQLEAQVIALERRIVALELKAISLPIPLPEDRQAEAMLRRGE
jgi:hypothetical protein